MKSTKKILAAIALLSAIIGTTVNTFGFIDRPAWIPNGALFRIDEDPFHPPSQMMDWKNMSNNGNWGQGKCSAEGNTCHAYDWVTWWYEGVQEPPIGDYEPVFYGDVNFPSYNPVTGLYEIDINP